MPDPPLAVFIRVVEYLPTAFVLADEAGYIVCASPAAIRLVGDPSVGGPHRIDHRLAASTPGPRRGAQSTIDTDLGRYELVSIVDRSDQSHASTDATALAREVSHEFNNLLGVIINFTTLAIGAQEPGSQTERDLGEVLAASRRAAHLTEQLTMLGATDPGMR